MEKNYDNDYDATASNQEEEWHKINPLILWIMYFAERVGIFYMVWNLTISRVFNLSQITLFECILIILFLKIFNRKVLVQ